MTKVTHKSGAVRFGTSHGFFASACALILIFVFAAAPLFGDSPWQGSAAVGSDSEFPPNGLYAASNTFPRNSIVDVTNVQNGRTARVIVVKRLEVPGVFLSVSPDAAKLLGMSSGNLAQLRATPVAMPGLTDVNQSRDLPYSPDPDVNPAASLVDPNQAIKADRLAQQQSTGTPAPSTAQAAAPNTVQAPATSPANTGQSTAPNVASTQPETQPQPQTAPEAQVQPNALPQPATQPSNQPASQTAAQPGSSVQQPEKSIQPLPSAAPQISSLPQQVTGPEVPLWAPRPAVLAARAPSAAPETPAGPEVSSALPQPAPSPVASPQIAQASSVPQPAAPSTNQVPEPVKTQASNGPQYASPENTNPVDSLLSSIQASNPESSRFAAPQPVGSLAILPPAHAPSESPPIPESSLAVAEPQQEKPATSLSEKSPTGGASPQGQVASPGVPTGATAAQPEPSLQVNVPPTQSVAGNVAVPNVPPQLLAETPLRSPAPANGSAVPSSAQIAAPSLPKGLVPEAAMKEPSAAPGQPIPGGSKVALPSTSPNPAPAVAAAGGGASGPSVSPLAPKVPAEPQITAQLPVASPGNGEVPSIADLRLNPATENLNAGVLPEARPEGGSIPEVTSLGPVAPPKVPGGVAEAELAVPSIAPSAPQPPEITGSSSAADIASTRAPEASMTSPVPPAQGSATTGKNAVPNTTSSVRDEILRPANGAAPTMLPESAEITLAPAQPRPPQSTATSSGAKSGIAAAAAEAGARAAGERSSLASAGTAGAGTEVPRTTEPSTAASQPATATGRSSNMPPVSEWAQKNLPLVATLQTQYYYLQVGAFSNPVSAKQAINDVAPGYPIVVMPSSIAGKTLYRVFVGPLNADEEGTVLYWFRARGYNDAFVRRGGES